MKYTITLENSELTRENLDILAGSIVEHCKREWVAQGIDPASVQFKFIMPNRMKEDIN